MEEFPSGQREQTVNLSAMPSVVRIHPLPPKNRLAFASLFFYPLRKQWHIIKGDLSPLYLISPSGLYIITPLGVYQKCFRNDDIQRLAPLMISTALPWWYAIPCGIDYIQCFALISTQENHPCMHIDVPDYHPLLSKRGGPLAVERFKNYNQSNLNTPTAYITLQLVAKLHFVLPSSDF